MNRQLLMTLVCCLVMALAIVPLSSAKSPKKGPSGPAEEPTDELIYGCYKKNNGQLRIVKDPGQCRPPEVPISWNEVGPEGPEGPPGPQGEPGPAGANGVSGYELLTCGTITVSNPILNGTGAESVTCPCPEGKKAIAGGIADLTFPITVENSRDFNIAALHPFNDVQWRVRFFNGTGVDVNVTLYTICVTAD